MPFVLTRRSGGGVSAAPFDRLNLAAHVGDEPAAVAANRAELHHALLGSGVRRMVWMGQVHGTTVAVIDKALLDQVAQDDRTSVIAVDVDGLVTAERGIGLVVLVADCVPLVLRDETNQVVGAVHVGRRGLADGIAGNAVAEMRALGASSIVATLGPSICAGCYEVPSDLRDEVERSAPGSWAVTRAGTPSIDLAAGLTAQLAALDVVSDVDARCTAEDPDLFSYRRDGLTGRFAAVAWLE